MNKQWSELNKEMQAQIKKEATWPEGIRPEGIFDEGEEKDMSIAEESEATNTEVSEPAGAKPKRKGGLFDGISTEDLLLLGVILLLSQEDEGNDVLPILLLLLFFRK